MCRPCLDPVLNNPTIKSMRQSESEHWLENRWCYDYSIFSCDDIVLFFLNLLELHCKLFINEVLQCLEFSL